MDTIRYGHRLIASLGEQLPLPRNAAHDRQVITCLKDTQDGRLAQRRAGADAGGQQIKARFVHTNQGRRSKQAFFQLGPDLRTLRRDGRFASLAGAFEWQLGRPLQRLE